MMTGTTKSNIETVKEILEAKGYKTEIVPVEKNGVIKTSICVGEGRVKTAFYPADEFALGWSVSKVVDSIITRLSTDNFSYEDISQFLKWDYAKDHLQLCIQKKTGEDILKRAFLDLEQYVRVNLPSKICSGGGVASYKVKPGTFDVDEAEIFERAYEQIKGNFFIGDMRKTLVKMGMAASEADLPEMPGFYVASYKSMEYGAAVICDTDLLREIAEQNNSDIAIIPSSVHECLLLVGQDRESAEFFDSMIREVNRTEVSLEEQLSDHVYFYSKAAGKIVY